jgi:branched-chain amino acid transport system permease protein
MRERARIVGRAWAGAARGVLLVAAIGVLAAVPWWADEGQARNLVEFFTLLALAQMWNLLAGYAGLVSIGQQAFVGIGAYSFYAFGDKWGIHPFAAVALAGLVSVALGLVTAVAAFRLRGGYFAIGTWVIAEVYHLLTVNTDWLGGGNGVTVLSAAGLDRTYRAHGTYFWALGVGVGSVLAAYVLLRSRVGLALTAIRDEEIAARTLGVDVLRTKVLVYLVAALGCGLAGAVVYLNLLRIQPEAAYDVNWTAYMIFIVVIGGIGTIEGPIIGTIVFFALQQELSQYGVWYLIILGSVAVVAAVWFRGGIWGTLVRRFDVRVFPIQRRVRVAPPVPGAARV